MAAPDIIAVSQSAEKYQVLTLSDEISSALGVKMGEKYRRGTVGVEGVARKSMKGLFKTPYSTL